LSGDSHLKWQGLSGGRGEEKEDLNTLKDNTERAFPNLLPNTKVVANDAGGGCGLRGVV
jgi:hypothetical protein